MDVITRVQIRQWNDWEILAFFNANDVKYSLTGDHLFVIHAHERDVLAGPGDWLSISSDGDVNVESASPQALAALASAGGDLPPAGR